MHLTNRNRTTSSTWWKHCTGCYSNNVFAWDLLLVNNLCPYFVLYKTKEKTKHHKDERYTNLSIKRVCEIFCRYVIYNFNIVIMLKIMLADEVIDLPRKRILACDNISPSYLSELSQYIIPGEKLVLEETVGQGSLIQNV